MSETVRELPDDETWEVEVYSDDPAWNRLGDRKWFYLPLPDLRRLYVCTYVVDGYRPTEEHPHVKWIRQQHPNSVLVY